MKNKTIFPLVAACLISASCTDKKQPAELTAGIDVTNMDTTFRPGADFYSYANAGWLKKHPLPAEYSRYATFDMLFENNQKNLLSLVQELAAKQNPQGSNAQKVADLYAVAMDSTRLNADGVAPLKGDLAAIDAIKTNADVYVALADLMKKGVGSYFYLYVGPDDKDSKNNALQMGQSGLSMGQRDYYLENDESTTKIREAFKLHVVKMMKLAGFEEAVANQTRDIVMDVETRLAKAFRSRVELRDPQANYNKMTLEELNKQYPSFPFESFFRQIGLNGVKDVIIGQPASLKEAENILKTLPVEKQQLYLKWKLIASAAPLLSDAFSAESFDFNSHVMGGAQAQQPRWKRALNAVDDAVGEALGQMYTEKYFPAAAKERMLALVKSEQQALGERIQALTWMSDSTKRQALDKLAAFRIKVGYPDKWKDYSTLTISKDKSYWENMKNVIEWYVKDEISKFGKPVDPTEWQMTPQTVNAYYNPTTNEICFPAGILQPPFFDMNADDAFNYGGIGVVIGHEMSHGFDDQGRQYDKEGNMKDWWTEQDAANFKERAQVMVNYFDSIEVAPGVFGNGSLTLGENIGDHGGLKIAYTAFKNATSQKPLPVKDGFTADQRFFLAYAGVWANQITPEEILRRTKSDPHSLGRWRVNGALPQIDAWYEAFGITESDPMYLPKEKRADIW